MNDQMTRTLAEHLRITEVDIRERKALLGLTQEDETELSRFRSASLGLVDDVVEEFYGHQTQVPKIRNIIGDAETLGRLRGAMKHYIVSLFDGEYGAEYVNSRLRIGKVHARIGVPPKLYVSSVHQLETILGEKLCALHDLDRVPPSLKKIFLFDLQLVFDTYIHSLLSEVELARDELQSYSESLEQIIDDRTKQVRVLAQTDELTGLGNRRKFHAEVAFQLAEAKRCGDSLGLIFVDLDNFKMINDEQGHWAGDRLLEQIGGAIRKQAQGGHIAFRYGGDEFCILVPGAGPEAAEKLLAEYRATITRDLKPPLGASLGIAFAGPESYPDLEGFVRMADHAMYDAKLAARARGNVKEIPRPAKGIGIAATDLVQAR